MAAFNSLGLNRSRSAVVFLVDETTPGTINAQPTTSDTFGLTTTPVIGQAGNYTDTSEIGAELISMDRVLNYMEYSTFDFEYYAKPGGITTTSGIDVAAFSAVAIAGDVATISYTAGNLPASITEGSTLTLTTNVSADNGTYVVTSVAGDDFTIQGSGLTFNSVTAISKITYDYSQTPEHELLVRSFGGVKYMSSGNTTDGSTNVRSAYYAGTTADAQTKAPAKADAAMAQYYLQNTIQTFTVTSRQFTDTSVQMYTATGALPTNFSVTLSKDGPVTFSSSFQGNRVYYAGTAEFTGVNPGSINANGTTSITLISPKRYDNATAVVAEDVAWYHSAQIGAQYTVHVTTGGTVVQTSAPFTVSAISGASVTLRNDTANAIAFPDGTGANAVSLLVPYTPTPCPDTGGILDQRKVQVFIADAPATAEDTSRMLDFNALSSDQLFHTSNSLDVTSVNFEFDRSITTPGLTEMTGEEFPPASYIINEPSITGSMTLLLRPKDFQFMNALREEPRRSVGVRVGLTSGRIIEMAISSAFMEIPTPSDADGATQIDIAFTAVRGVECDDADKFMVRYR